MELRPLLAGQAYHDLQQHPHQQVRYLAAAFSGVDKSAIPHQSCLRCACAECRVACVRIPAPLPHRCEARDFWLMWQCVPVPFRVPQLIDALDKLHAEARQAFSRARMAVLGLMQVFALPPCVFVRQAAGCLFFLPSLRFACVIDSPLLRRGFPRTIMRFPSLTRGASCLIQADSFGRFRASVEFKVRCGGCSVRPVLPESSERATRVVAFCGVVLSAWFCVATRCGFGQPFTD